MRTPADARNYRNQFKETTLETDPKALTHKLALVTGAGRGIGSAIASKLAAMGARVVLCGRTRQPLEVTAEAISNERGQAEAAECDVSSLRSVEALAGRVEQEFGRVDILVN